MHSMPNVSSWYSFLDAIRFGAQSGRSVLEFRFWYKFGVDLQFSVFFPDSFFVIILLRSAILTLTNFDSF